MFTHPCTSLDTLQRVVRGLLSFKIKEDKPGTLLPLYGSFWEKYKQRNGGSWCNNEISNI